NKQQHAPAGTQHTPHLFQSGEVVVHVFDDVERRNQVKRAVVVRHLFTRAECDLVQSSLATKRERVLGNVYALGVTVLRKHQQIGASSATHVENARASV